MGGRGGIVLADARVLRSEVDQQAGVLTFTFSGFAGLSGAQGRGAMFGGTVGRR